jgi:hypothetical protein
MVGARFTFFVGVKGRGKHGWEAQILYQFIPPPDSLLLKLTVFNNCKKRAWGHAHIAW